MASGPIYSLLLIYNTLVTYVFALAINRILKNNIRKYALSFGLILNFATLVLFKYYNFLSSILDNLTKHLHLIATTSPALNLTLPIGISFFTFLSAGYLIDVYRRKIGPERHLGIYALYVSFFPQLLSGPIERSFNMLPQLRQRYDFDYAKVVAGLKRMAWGYFLKVVIADNLAVFVNNIFSNPRGFSGPDLILASYFFAFQIFCDFAGYTEIAIGVAKIMGYDLMENFERPYFAKSIPEFWRKWHISLSTWLRDYLYIPLGGNRVPLPVWCLNIMIVFFVCGLWHGANWTFVVWGGLHGLYMITSVTTKKLRVRLARAVGFDLGAWYVKCAKILITFNLVCLGWIVFRANNIGDAYYIITHLFRNMRVNVPANISLSAFVLDFILVVLLIAVHIIQRKVRIGDYMARQPVYFRWSSYIVLVSAILFLGRFEGTSFIYFRF